MIKIWLFATSQPLVFHDVANTYTKDGLYCIKLGRTVVKFPLCNVFKIEEPYDFSEA